MTATKISTRIEVPAEWLGGWATIITEAHDAAGDIQSGGRAKEFMAGVSVRVVPDGYSTSDDGRDWAGSSSPTVHVQTYEESAECGVTARTVERCLMEAVAALENLPGGMGIRHGRLEVSVRTDGKRPQVYRTWTLAEEGGRGVRFTAAPEVE